jgi:serine/threonine-protein kinase
MAATGGGMSAATRCAGMMGTTIGTYRVLHVLGQGGMGTVYLAEHVLLGRRAALKILLPAYSMDQEIVRRFFNEARAVTSIADPGIVQIFDFGFHTDGSAYIVMELLEGEPLDARLRRHGRLSPLDAVRLVRQCAGSLAAAHAKGIIHRDLKPENLYAVGDPAVTGGERLKILDFGIAKLIGDDVATSKTRTGMLIGTPIYMSPEQCRGMGEIDFRSDVYSLGCVLFALLAGRPPFVCESSGELIVAHLREHAPAVSELAPVPRELDDIVRCCLAKAPGDRYASMQALGHALDLVAATALYHPPAHSSPHLTPAPLASVSVAAAVTTLRSASGESIVSPAATPARRRHRVIAASALTAVALGVGAVMLGSARVGKHALDGSGGQAAQAAQATPSASPGVVPEPASAPAGGAGLDAPASSALPAPSGPPGPAMPGDPAVVPADAGTDAASRAPPAGKPAHVHRPRPRPTQEDSHAAPATTGSASMDRGD